MAVPASELVRKAGELTSMAKAVSAATVVATLRSAIRLFDEVPGNPDSLDDLAAAYRNAGAGVQEVGAQAKTVGGTRIPAVWSGRAGNAAARSINWYGSELELGKQVFDVVAEAVGVLAGRLRQLRKEHGEIRQSLTEILNTAEAAGDDEVRLVHQAHLAGPLLSQAGSVLTRAQDAHATTMTALTEPMALPGQLRKPSTWEILQKYQVEPDPDGTVKFPVPKYGKEITKTERDLLDDIGFRGQRDVQEIRQKAIDAANEQFPDKEQQDNHLDAFRHTYANALLARRFGDDWAERFTTAHERLPGNRPDQEAMDLYNNELGRRIAAQHPDAGEDQLKALVKQAIDRGDAVVIDRGGDLQHSDAVPRGQVGRADDEPSERPNADSLGSDSGGSGSTGSGNQEY
ncbi:DUF6973 domain-containing protein [Actinokineospora iranica]|uniref:DUF6973 domain-containing protein n=1 Tax=Actinokineospora iranica TaxID=1271860 RepID=A0A1G6WPN7_9PSEU|nr:hypothetical protein [Actinokineospora iranica]SDD67197.1 hypothetical protein SAMN05216174_11591 [Actinokineospora iranica]